MDFIRHRKSFDFSRKPYFERLHLLLHSFGHRSRLMTVGEYGTNIDLNNERFASFITVLTGALTYAFAL